MRRPGVEVAAKGQQPGLVGLAALDGVYGQGRDESCGEIHALGDDAAGQGEQRKGHGGQGKCVGKARATSLGKRLPRRAGRDSGEQGRRQERLSGQAENEQRGKDHEGQGPHGGVPGKKAGRGGGGMGRHGPGW